MAGAPEYKVYNAAGEYVAACKYVEDAASIVAQYGDRSVIRWRHQTVVWREGSEDQPAAESYDHVREVVMARRAAPMTTWRDKPKPYKNGIHPGKKANAVERRPPRKWPSVFAKERSDAVKLGGVSATYVAQQSCPDTCPLAGGGCYAEHGPFFMVVTRHLNGRSEGDAIEIARQEAEAIDTLTGKRDLRLHAVGDSTTSEGTRLLAEAARRFSLRAILRHKVVSKVWTYTHAWRTVSRDDWGSVSVLASCETLADVKEAHARGYATALMVKEHTGRKLSDGVLPCPEQTTPGVTCRTCRLCMDATGLWERGITIGFALHGDTIGLKRARTTLERLNGGT